MDETGPVGTIWLAAIDAPGSAATAEPRRDGLIIERWGTVLRIGAGLATAADPRERVAAAMAVVALALEFHPAVSLRWLASPVVLDRQALAAADREWREHAEPPLFSLIAIEALDTRGARGALVRTRGLRIFAGYELEGEADSPDARVALARAITWLARNALAGKELAPGGFRGPDGLGRVALVRSKAPGVGAILQVSLTA